MAKLNQQDLKRIALRETLWPGSSAWIWDIKDQEKVVGYVAISRLMPWILSLIKTLAGGGKTGEPSSAYLELWCRDYGQGIISIADEEECAFASGYSSTRAHRTWKEHMAKLKELGFILSMMEGLREYGQILLLNPIAVCERLHQEKRVPEQWWTSFVRRARDIKAKLPGPLVLPESVLGSEQ